MNATRENTKTFWRKETTLLGQAYTIPDKTWNEAIIVIFEPKAREVAYTFNIPKDIIYVNSPITLSEGYGWTNDASKNVCQVRFDGSIIKPLNLINAGIDYSKTCSMDIYYR